MPVLLFFIHEGQPLVNHSRRFYPEPCFLGCKKRRGAGDPAERYATMKKVQTTIAMKDGVRLAVNLYMPDGAKPDDKFPVILEYLPYRKDDWSLSRDWDLHPYWVRRGYVTARVDIRGTGASEGGPPDREYSDQEQQDGARSD